MSHRREINCILKQVKSWPPEDQQALAMELLHSTRLPSASALSRDTLSLAKAVAASITRPPPTDEEVERWIHEHRMTKYGGGVR